MVLTLTELRMIPPWLHLLGLLVMIVASVILLWSHYG